MSEILSLAEVFLKNAARAGTGPQLAPEVLGNLLLDVWERGRAGWPDIALPASVIAENLAAHADAVADPGSFLSSVHAADLYLACACAQGIPAALKAFDSTLISQVPAALARLRRPPPFADEVCQCLRDRLLVAEAGARPRITQYSGEHPLVNWVRMVARRTALNLLRGQGELLGDEERQEQAIAADNPELDYIKARYQKEFKDAFRDAFAALPEEQRRVVRLHFVGGLTGDKMALLLGVNRATVVRRLASARSGLLLETRRLLQQRLRLSPAEMDSLIEMVRSRLDLSIGTFLKEVPE